MWTGIVSIIGKAFTSWNDGRVQIKKAKLETVIAKEKAKAKRFELESTAESSWDLQAQRAAENSWKDEYLMVIITLPFIGAFIPQLQDYVLTGFEYLDQTPYWYQLSFIGLIAAAFGLRWLFSNRLSKMLKGGK